MDFIISYQLYNNLKKKELSDELKELKEERSPVRESCSRCGQNPYLCQCQCDHQYDLQQECEKQSSKKYRFSESRVFHPEKDNY